MGFLKITLPFLVLIFATGCGRLRSKNPEALKVFAQDGGACVGCPFNNPPGQQQPGMPFPNNPQAPNFQVGWGGAPQGNFDLNFAAGQQQFQAVQAAQAAAAVASAAAAAAFGSAINAAVLQAYRDFLGRDGNYEEMKGWIGLAVAQGVGEMRYQIAGTPEAIAYRINIQGFWDPYEAAVNQAYLEFLHRRPDVGGFIGWVAHARAAGVDSMRALIFNSPEGHSVRGA